MTGQAFLEQAFVYLCAAVIAVPLASRLGLGSITGYLLAGVAIGPFALGLVGAEGQDVMSFAQFGVVMMLFVIGLELQPSVLWRLRTSILGFGGLQVLATAALVLPAAVLLGLPWQAGLALGLVVSLSSTPIGLQAVQERGQMGTAGGQTTFSVLLFQDIAVIPMLALFPLLATYEVAAVGAGAPPSLISQLPPWARTLAVLGSVGGIVLGGRFLMRPMFRALARTRLREIFTAAALLLVIAITLLMTLVGLSPALGAFVAGVVLASSEYRHELVSDIDPFKGLLLGLFFIAVGASIDFGLIAARPLVITGLVVGVMLLKFGVLAALARAFGLGIDQALLVAFAVPQVGEFAFVLLAFGAEQGVFPVTVSAPLVATAALSMAFTPLLLALNDRVIRPRLGTREAPQREADEVSEHAPVLVAGFGAFGSTVGRLLKANGIGTTVLEFDSDRVELLRRMGLKVYYGDATRHDLLATAGAEHARAIVLALDTPERTLQLARTVQRHFPHLVVLARAFGFEDAHALLDAGVDHVYRESVDTSARLGVDVLRLMGFHGHEAHRAAARFLRHEERTLRELTAHRGDQERYIDAARRAILELERVLEADRSAPDRAADGAWDPQSLRDEVRRGSPAAPATPAT